MSIIPEVVRAELIKYFKNHTTMNRWLYGSNSHLNGARPIDCLRSGQTKKVLEALNKLVAGTYV